MNHLDYLPRAWDDDIDVAFFGIVARLFGPEFVFGATVLLGSYDSSPGACPGPQGSAFGQVGPIPEDTAHRPWVRR